MKHTHSQTAYTSTHPNLEGNSVGRFKVSSGKHAAPNPGICSRAGAPRGRAGDRVPAALRPGHPADGARCPPAVPALPPSLPGGNRLRPQGPPRARVERRRTGTRSPHASRSARASLTCPAGAVGRCLAASRRPPRRRSTREPQSPGHLSGAERHSSSRHRGCARRATPALQVRARRRSWARGAEVAVRGSRGWRGAPR